MNNPSSNYHNWSLLPAAPTMYDLPSEDPEEPGLPVVLQADENAARNVLARLSDPEIDWWMPFKKVKSILLQRTERLRLGLLNLDSSCKPQGLSTESELPNYLNS